MVTPGSTQELPLGDAVDALFPHDVPRLFVAVTL